LLANGQAVCILYFLNSGKGAITHTDALAEGCCIGVVITEFQSLAVGSFLIVGGLLGGVGIIDFADYPRFVVEVLYLSFFQFSGDGRTAAADDVSDSLMGQASFVQCFNFCTFVLGEMLSFAAWFNFHLFVHPLVRLYKHSGRDGTIVKVG